jgi:hypothetical protein
MLLGREKKSGSINHGFGEPARRMVEGMTDKWSSLFWQLDVV